MSAQRFYAGCSMLFLIGLVLFLGTVPGTQAAAEKLRTENIIYVMMDGVRVQEMFGGADEELLPKEGGAAELVWVAQPRRLRVAGGACFRACS